MKPEFGAHFIWSYGLAFAGYCILTFAIDAKRRREPDDAHFASLLVASTATAAWALAGVAIFLEHSSLTVVVYELLDIIRYGAWYVLLIDLICGSASNSRLRQTRVQMRLRMVGTGLIVTAIALQAGFLFSAEGEALLVKPYLYSGVALAAFGLLLLEQIFRSIATDSRWNIKPLGIALGAIFAYDIYLKSTSILFLKQDIDAMAIRGVANLIVIPLIVLYLSRRDARSMKFSISQSAAFHTTSLIAVGAYLVVTAAAGYYVKFIGGSWGGALRISILFAAALVLVLLALSGTVRARIRMFVGKNFFRYRYDYRAEWLQFTHALATDTTEGGIGHRIIKALANIVESPAGGLWSQSAGGKDFYVAARWNIPDQPPIDAAALGLVTSLAEQGRILDLAVYRARPGSYPGLALPPWLESIPNAWLLIPLRMNAVAIGFVVLATPRIPLEVNWEVNDLIETASLQAASFLGQMQATEALLEARKFDSFNRMSAFVVHDLKNIIAQLSLMLKNAERHKENVEFQRDMLTTVQHSVDRMRQLMLQLREGTTPADRATKSDLGEIIRRIQQTKVVQFPNIEVHTSAQLAARGHPERVERVIGHLVQNAIEATPMDGKISIRLARQGSSAIVEVQDTGMGMTDEFVKERLFRPFSTTKASGMGIGAYESLHYVRELGGQIDVKTRPGKGTTFTVTLPLLDVEQAPDLAERMDRGR